MARDSVKRSAVWSFIMNWAQQGTNAAFVFILAAILGPETFGVVAVAAIFVTFIQMLVEQGLSLPLQQRAELSREHQDSAFWALSGWALLLTVIALALAPWWGAMNDASLVADVVLALAPLLLVHAVCVVPRTMLTRSLRFRSLTAATTSSALIGGIAGVVAAVQGAGVWSLVVQQWVSTGLATILTWRYAGYRPRLYLSSARLKELLPVASGSFLNQLAAFANARADAILVGLFFGPLAVGLYRLADRIIQLAMTLLARPLALFALPYLATHQNDPAAFAQGARNCIGISTALVVPVMGVVVAVSPLMTAVIGPEWHLAWIAISLLAVVGAVQSVALFAPQLLNAAGRSHMAAATSWISALMSVVTFVIAGYLARDASTAEQLAAIAGSRAAMSVLLSLPFYLVVVRNASGLRLGELAKELVAPTCSGVVGMALAAAAMHLDPVGFAPAWVRLLVYGTLGYGAALFVTYRLDARLRAEVESLLQRISARRRGTGAGAATAAAAEGADAAER